MSRIPPDLKYTKSHEWLRMLPDGNVEIGISDHAQEELGDLVFIELPQVGRKLTAGEACAVVESVKAASDIYAPIGGTVLATNEQLAQSPELVNRDPYGSGWLIRLKPAQTAAGPELLSPDAYATLAEEG